ncbi:hypothetical protein Tco_0273092 [Tanacetum coccineum]
MTSFDYRLNPIYAIKECSTCGVLYTADFCCSKKGLEDKILVPKPPRNCARCARCGTPVDGPYCQGCALLRKKFKEDLFTYCVENEFFEDLQDTSESSDDNTNVVNAPQEPFVGNQDPGENSSPSPLVTSALYKRRKKKGELRKIKRVNIDIGRFPFAIDDDKRHHCNTPIGGQFDMIISSSDDDSPYDEDIDYVNASPPDVEIVSVEGVEIVIPEVGGIDTDVLLTIKDDILREKLLNVNLLIANIEALKDNPTPSSDVMTKSSSTFLNLFLEETNTFDNSSPEPETFRFNLEEISSGSPTTHSELSLPDDKAFYVDNDHFKEKSSGSTTTHVDFSQYDSFIFDLSNDHFPPADRSDFNHEEFADELAHIMSLPNLECFKFKVEPDLGDLTSIDLGIHKNVSTTNVNVPLRG